MTFNPVLPQYQYPRYLCGDMIHAKQKLQDAMAKYFAASKEARAEVSWFNARLKKK